jgi:hypothetical protein
MSQQTPTHAGPIVVGAMLPVGFKVRMIMNGIGALYVFWDVYWCRIILSLSYIAYVGQYVFGKKWLHAVFHLLLHYALYLAAVNPTAKYSLEINPVWAWPVFWAPVVWNFIISPKFRIVDKTPNP